MGWTEPIHGFLAATKRRANFINRHRLEKAILVGLNGRHSRAEEVNRLAWTRLAGQRCCGKRSSKTFGFQRQTILKPV